MREQKIENIKNISFDNYNQTKRDRLEHAKPKPMRPQTTWYTDNTYATQADELDESYEEECLKYGTYRKLRNIREQDEYYDEDHLDDDIDGDAMRGRRGEGEGSPAEYGLQRSTSCKDFQYTKSQSFCFDGNEYGGETKAAAPISILKKTRVNVPKSYSFSVGTRATPFDIVDYDMPPTRSSRRARQEAFRKSMGYYCSNSLDESTLTGVHEGHACCAREHCTSAKCLLDEMYPSYHASGSRGATCCRGTTSGIYGAGASGSSNRNLHATDHNECWYDDRCNHRVATVPCYLPHSGYEREREREQPPPPPPTVICCCAADDYCYHRQQQRHIARPRAHLYCPGHHPAAEDEEHLHCRAYAYDTDLEHFIRDERERLLMQDKFLDDDERFLSVGTNQQYATGYRRPARSKSYLEVHPPICYEEDTCSDSTEMDLEDFNIDLEKYWEELDKPPSPIDIDMQRRNMQSNLKVKNVNVGCYNNGQPIELHERDQGHMLQKTLLQGLPPGACTEQFVEPTLPNNAGDFNFYENSASPLHRPFNYCHKVYPAAETLPTYKYNNFYPEHGVQTQQPTSSGHHTSAGGHSALSLINNIFSIYKPNKYSPHNCQMNDEPKPELCKKMNIPSTRRPLGAPHSEYMHSMKRPLIVSTEQPHFKIIPEKTGLKISPLYAFDDYSDKPQVRHKLTSTARPLMFPH